MATLAVIAAFIAAELPHELVWRITLGLGAVPALVILLMRHDLPETAVWLVRRGRFREAKAVSQSMYGDDLAMLPNEDVVVPKPHTTEFLADLRRDPVRWRATIYGWIACFCQGSEFATFGFYLPVIFATVGVGSMLGNDLVTDGAVLPGRGVRLGRPAAHAQDRPSRASASRASAIVLVSLLVAAVGDLHRPPLRAAVRRGGDAVGPLLGCLELHDDPDDGRRGRNIAARPAASPTCSSSCRPSCPSSCSRCCSPPIGQAGATLFVAIFPLVGLLAAMFILPEVMATSRTDPKASPATAGEGAWRVKPPWSWRQGSPRSPRRRRHTSASCRV